MSCIILYLQRPTYDEGAKECTHEMVKEHNQCLTKSEDKTYLETYNCEYIKSPKPERFARAMVSCSLSLMYQILFLNGLISSPFILVLPFNAIEQRNNSIAPILCYHTLSTIQR